MTMSRYLACIISMAAMALTVSSARAELLNAHFSIMPPTGGEFIASTSVATMAYVTNSPIVGKATYIEISGSSAAGGFQLRIQSKEPQRVLEFWNQIAQATLAQRDFQITVWSVRTFPAGDSTGYVGDLDTGWNYFILE